MRAFKFLGPGSVGLFSGFAWPRPKGGGPGAWVEAGGPLEPCRVGVHAVRGSNLLDWMDDELWCVELAGRVIDDVGVLVAERGRLLTRVVGWDEAAARGLTEACTGRLHARAVRAPDASAVAARVALADVISLAAGARPDSGGAPHPDAAPSQAAVAANVGCVVARTLAATDEENDYATAFAAERAWQLQWLADRLDLGDPGDPAVGLFV